MHQPEGCGGVCRNSTHVRGQYGRTKSIGQGGSHMQIPACDNGKQGIVDEYRYLLRLVTVVLLTVTGCSKPHPLNPTYEELVHRGFYIYVLPSNEVAARKWQETVSIWSWDRHCSGVELSETANPIRVVYTGESDQPPSVLT